MKKTISLWKEIKYEHGEAPLGTSALHRLRDNQCAIVVIKGLLNAEILRSIRKSIDENRHQATVTSYVNGALTTIGSYLAKNLSDLDSYFSHSLATDPLFANATVDLRAYVREKLKRIFGLKSLEVACESDGRQYAPAIIRLHADGVENPLHNDHIVRDAAFTGLILSQLQTQLSCVVCIQECEQGGRLRHYRKKWEPSDEQYKVQNGLGYQAEVVAGAERFIFEPKVGDVYLINPTNYHEIDRVMGGERRTMGFFIGFFDSSMERGVVWS